MYAMTSMKRYMLTAMCISLCIVIPQALHFIPNAGSVFLPMHIPVLLCGLVCGGPYGLMCGSIGPLLSSVLTGMPPAAVLPSMMVECAVYGLVSGVLAERIHSGSDTFDLYAALIPAMLMGRIAAGFTKALLFGAEEMTFGIWIGVHFITAFPGIVIQLILLPAMLRSLRRAKIISGQEEKSWIKAM